MCTFPDVSIRKTLLLFFSDRPDPDTGMWIVEPEYDENNFQSISVIHIDTILCAAHLLPIFDGDTLVDRT